MKRNLFCWLALGSLGLMLNACQQPANPPTQTQFRLTKVTKTFPHANSLPIETRYSYTPDGWLAAATSQTTDGAAADVSVRFTYNYDAQHRINKATTTITGNHRYELYFDSLGRFTAKYEYSTDPINGSLTNEVHLIYAEDMVPVRVINLQGRLGMARDSLIESYTYTNHNVVQRVVRLRTQNTSYDKTNTVSTYQYDTHANPYYRVIFGYYLDPDWHTFSQNNVLNADEQLSYDSRGLLTKVRQVDGNYEYDYEYEAY